MPQEMTTWRAREIARPHQGPPGTADPIRRFVATGEIAPALLAELCDAQDGRYIEGNLEDWDRLDGLIEYVREAGPRPAVPGWPWAAP
ncbi:hypothetical protein [Streptomyces sp. PTD5-9]|uniref:hypothetical protein n=1 Tax=Streptomyces sp. PTD5-9 TaxID=3120150 RepID=UPI00300B3499